MARIVVSEFITLDGVIERPGEDGWTFEFNFGTEGNKFKLDEIQTADALLLGRVTYDGFAAAWPSMRDEAGFADRMNSMPKFVVSSILQQASWNNTTVISGDVAAEVASLKQQFAGEIVIEGSAQLAQSLLQHDLIDVYRLMVYPVVLGGGKRLFREGLPRTAMQLTGTQPAGDCVVLTYEPKGRARAAAP